MERRKQSVILGKIAVIFAFAAALALIFRPAAAFAQDAPKKPLRLAVLALHVDELPPDAQEYFAREVELATHVPLNNTLQAVEYIDNQTAADALVALFNSGVYQKKRKFDYKAAMRPLAESLNADLVLVFSVDYAYETVYTLAFGETMVDAGVQISLCGWDECEALAAAKAADEIAADGVGATAAKAKKAKKTKQPGLISRTECRRLHDEYFGRGLSYVAAEAIDYIIAAENIRARVFPKRR